MIRYFYVHLFYKKRVFFLFISLLMIPLLMVLLSDTGVSSYQVMLFIDDYQAYYLEIVQKTMVLVLPFYTILITMDHDQSFIKPLYAYFGRYQVISRKIFLYWIVLLWLYSFVFMCSFIIFFIRFPYQSISLFEIMFYLDLFLDSLLIFTFVLYLIKDKNKALSIMISLVYILISFYQEDHQSLLVFYLFPIHYPRISSYTLAYVYKICYILLGLNLSYKKMLTEEI